MLSGALGQTLGASELPTTDWQKVLRLSSAHLVAPLLRWALLEQGRFSDLPADAAEFLEAVYSLNLDRNHQCVDQLAHATVAAHHRRFAGSHARLLVPPPTAWDSEPVKLRCLVFPRFDDGTAPQLHRISSFQAIERLLTDRVWIGNPITSDRVATFLAWLDDTPAYMSVYGDLDDGMRHIEDLAA